MKFSKILNWIGQCIAFIITKITAAVEAITATVSEATAKVIAEVTAVVNSAAAQTAKDVSATVAESGAATIQAVNERSADSQKQFEVVNAKLDSLVVTESEDELRKAFESTLPKELLEKFQF